MKRIIKGLILLSILYTGIWYFVANEGRQRLTSDLNLLQKKLLEKEDELKHLSYDRISLAGYPFRFDYQIEGLKFTTDTREITCDDVVKVGTTLFATSLSIMTEGDIYISAHSETDLGKIEELSKIEGFSIFSRLRKADGSQEFLSSLDGLEQNEKLEFLLRQGKVNLGPSWSVLWSEEHEKQYLFKWNGVELGFNVNNDQIEDPDVLGSTFFVDATGLGMQVSGQEKKPTDLLKNAVLEDGKGIDVYLNAKCSFKFPFGIEKNINNLTNDAIGLHCSMMSSISGSPLFNHRNVSNISFLCKGDEDKDGKQGFTGNIEFFLKEEYPEGMDVHLQNAAKTFGLNRRIEEYQAFKHVHVLEGGFYGQSDFATSEQDIADGMFYFGTQLESNLGGVGTFTEVEFENVNLTSPKDIVLGAKYSAEGRVTIMNYQTYLLHLLESNQFFFQGKNVSHEDLEKFSSTIARFLEKVADNYQDGDPTLNIIWEATENKIKVGDLTADRLLFTWFDVVSQVEKEQQV
ncbi:MAG: hypothetical protein CMO81_00805 [Waddliaceae bacterium]|nr:hypothetical protein [Waddliaceae bacterium]